MNRKFEDELKKIYQNLIAGDDSKSYFAQPVPGYPWVRLAIKDGCLALVTLQTDPAGLYDIELEHIKVQFNLRVEIQTDSKLKTETVSIIECKHAEPWLVTTFLELTFMVLLSLNPDPASPDDVNKVLLNLVNLFRALKQPSGKSIQGLWGELFVIYESHDPTEAVRNWHSTPNDRYDFAKILERIEIKTTIGVRRHSFSHEQLASLLSLKVTIASLILNRSDEGLSCSDIIANLLTRISEPKIRHELIAKCVKTLGSEWRHQSPIKFDSSSARIALKWFDVGSIPKIPSPLPQHIHNVKYESDLQTTPELTGEELGNRGPLLKNLTMSSSQTLT